MTFDAAKVPGGDVGRWGAECRANALQGVGSQDWRGVYEWTKSWIGESSVRKVPQPIVWKEISTFFTR